MAGGEDKEGGDAVEIAHFYHGVLGEVVLLRVVTAELKQDPDISITRNNVVGVVGVLCRDAHVIENVVLFLVHITINPGVHAMVVARTPNNTEGL